MGNTDIKKEALEAGKAEQLSPLQLNGIKLDDKHTVLTPKRLEEMEK